MHILEWPQDAAAFELVLPFAPHQVAAPACASHADARRRIGRRRLGLVAHGLVGTDSDVRDCSDCSDCSDCRPAATAGRGGRGGRSRAGPRRAGEGAKEGGR